MVRLEFFVQLFEQEFGKLLSEKLWPSLQAPLRILLDPGERLFGGFLLSSLAIALVFLFSSGRQGKPPPAGLREQLGLTRAIWFHPSARLDYQLLICRVVVGGLFFPALLFGALDIMALVAAVLQLSLGASPQWHCPYWLVVGGYTLTIFLADDLSRYLLHRAMHRCRWLWQLHQVHHSAEVLTPVSLHRIHPLEGMLYAYRGCLTTGIVTGVAFYLFRGQMGAFELLGVNGLGFGFNLMGANLRHSHIRLGYGNVLERWLISPGQHQIHHSLDECHENKNYGSFLAIWDRCAGSLYLSQGVPELQFGLSVGERNHGTSLLAALWQPLRAVGKVVWQGRVKGGSREKLLQR